MQRYSIQLDDGTPISMNGTAAQAALYIANCGGRVIGVQTLPDRLVTNSQAGPDIATYRDVTNSQAGSGVPNYRPVTVQEALELPTMKFVNNGLPELHQEKQTLIETLVGCGYSEAELSGLPLGKLRSLVAPVQEEENVLPLPSMTFEEQETDIPVPTTPRHDYSGNGLVAMESDNVLPLPTMNFEKPAPAGRARPSQKPRPTRGQEALPLPRMF